MLFFSITQAIADYLNQDGKLAKRRLLFCLLNVTSSGGLVGLFLLAVLAYLRSVTPATLLIVLFAIVVFGAGDSLLALHRVEYRRTQKRYSSRFTLLCVAPLALFLAAGLVLLALGL